jgi:hypothetical protein
MARTLETYIRINPDGTSALIEASVQAISHTSMLSQLTDIEAPSNKALIVPGYKPDSFLVFDMQTSFSHYYELWNSIGITGRWGLSDHDEIKSSLSPTWQLGHMCNAVSDGFPLEDEFEFKLPSEGQFLFHVARNPGTEEATACLYATQMSVKGSRQLYHPLIPNVWGANGTPEGSLCFGEVRAPAMTNFMGFEAYCRSVFETWHAGGINKDLFDVVSHTVPDEMYQFDPNTKAQVPATFAWDWDTQGTVIRGKSPWEMEITDAIA